MRKAGCVAAGLAALSVFAGVCRAERVLVAKVEHFDGTTEYKVLDSEEYRALNAELRDEARLLSKAYEAAEQEWKETRPDDRFMFSKPTARRAITMRTFTSREDAEKAKEKAEEQEDRAATKRAADEDKKYQDALKGTKDEKKKAKLKEDREEEKARAATREEAVDLFVEKLKELQTRPAEEAAATAAPAKAAAEGEEPGEKPAEKKKKVDLFL